MMGDQCPMDMEMPTPDQMAAAVGEDLADKSMSAAGMCMNDDVKEVMSKAKEMMTMMKDGGMDQMMGDMMSGDMGGMDDAMCEEMKEGMCTMGKFQHCVLQKMDWTCPMGIPNYEVIVKYNISTSFFSLHLTISFFTFTAFTSASTLSLRSSVRTSARRAPAWRTCAATWPA